MRNIFQLVEQDLLFLYFRVFSNNHFCGLYPRVVCDYKHNLLETVDQIEFSFSTDKDRKNKVIDKQIVSWMWNKDLRCFPTGEIFFFLLKNLVFPIVLIEVIEVLSLEFESYIMSLLV